MRQHVKRLKAKCSQAIAFGRTTRTPLPLILDSFKLRRQPFVAETHDGLKIRLLPARGESFTFYENLIRRDYFSHGIQVRPGDTVIDIGANIGAFTLLASKAVGPTGRVIAFEPSSATHARLAETVRLNNLTNVTLVRCAIGGEEGTAQLDVGVKSAYASILPGVDGRAPSGATETVPVRPLDTVLRELGVAGPISLLKVDCEGAEYGIFSTFPPDVAARVSQIAMEVHDVPGHSRQELVDRLNALGFEPRATHPFTALRKSPLPN